MVNRSDLLPVSEKLSPYYDSMLAFPGYYESVYYPSDYPIYGSVSTTFVADTIVYLPFVPKETHTFTGISVYNSGTGDSGNNLRMGIFSANTKSRPGALVVDGNEITLDGTAALRTAVISEALSKGILYFLALVCDTSTSFMAYDNTPLLDHLTGQHIWGLRSDQTDAPISYVATEAHSYAALPDPGALDGFRILAATPIIYLKG